MKKIVIMLIIIFLAGCGNEEYPYVKGENLSVVFFDVGQGDSALIVAPDGVKVLIDCGEFEDAALYLKEMNITWIDLLVISHPDKDHLGGCDDVQEIVEIGSVLTNENIMEDFVIELTNTTFLEAIVVYDSNGRFKGENDNSVMIKIGYGNISLLFTGDCEWKCEKELVKTQNIDVDVLKVGHHGSKYSSTYDFLEMVSPSAAVISSGKENRYGHPTNETLKRLEHVGAEVYRTDLNGTMIFTTDGTKYALT